MNYPKIGETYKLAQEMFFLSIDSYDEGNAQGTCHFNEGDIIRFDSVLDLVDEEFKVGPKINWTDSLICHLNSPLDEDYCCVVPYRLLVELVQAGVLIKTEDSMTDKLTKILDTNVEDMGFSARTLNVLRQLPEPVTVRRLVSMTESDLLKRRMCGVKVLGEVKAKLTQLGVAFLPPR